ncbi:MAG: GntR family transcriptional regulator, partial [Chitinophagaceae bacterium]
MKKDTLSLININSKLAVPVYRQIVQSICKGIDDGLIGQNDKLPSVNGIAEKFSLARGSVFSAYNDLRASGIIDSIPGKGYFVTSTQTKQRQSVLLLFNTFSADNEILYNSILQNLSPGTRLDVFFHHHDRIQFETLIREKASYYNALIIVPEIYKDVLNVFENIDPK